VSESEGEYRVKGIDQQRQPYRENAVVAEN